MKYASRSVWKISPDDRGRQWQTWLERGVAAVGFSMSGRVGDVGQFSDVDDLIEKYRQLGVERPHMRAKQLWRFFRVVQDGDLLVAYKLYQILDVGIVRTPCRFEWDESAKARELFCYRRDAKWLGLGPIKLSSPTSRRYMSRNLTLFQIEDEASKNEVRQMLPKTGITGTVAKNLMRGQFEAADCGPPPRIRTHIQRVIRTPRSVLR